ncbi:hypothetical protein [Fonticella tunisiensis]|uniref:hypothetical protein n=1 Tax=Fonticella tunisiensis TaxID=1096341 RepID=UPI001A9AB705|nr:hypothetical protein [Fonticella tunisiensis]
MVIQRIGLRLFPYDFVERYDSKLIYNEVQREFAFLKFDVVNDIYEQYCYYTCGRYLENMAKIL